jgi:hypothetical protein
MLKLGKQSVNAIEMVSGKFKNVSANAAIHDNITMDVALDLYGLNNNETKININQMKSKQMDTAATLRKQQNETKKISKDDEETTIYKDKNGRRKKNRPSNRRKLVDTQFSKIEGVELSINPMDFGNKNNLPAVALEGNPPAPLNMPMPCDVPGWEMYMDNDSGQAFYTNTATGETAWEKPDNNGKQNGTIMLSLCQCPCQQGCCSELMFDNFFFLFSGGQDDNWVAHIDPETKKPYYANETTGRSTWTEQPQRV